MSTSLSKQEYTDVETLLRLIGNIDTEGAPPFLHNRFWEQTEGGTYPDEVKCGWKDENDPGAQNKYVDDENPLLQVGDAMAASLVKQVNMMRERLNEINRQASEQLNELLPQLRDQVNVSSEELKATTREVLSIMGESQQMEEEVNFLTMLCRNAFSGETVVWEKM